MPVGDGSPSSKMDSAPSQSSSISANNSTSSKFSDSFTKTESASSSSLSESSCSGGDGDGNETVAGDVGFCSSSKPHRGNDVRWVAIHRAKSKSCGELGLSDFRLLKKLGFGDIGSVYMADLRRGGGGGCLFAMKVMDKESLAVRKKLGRARTEREILSLLDHPFLPTLYSHFETDKFSCLLMEFCSGGDLHTLRQRQPGKHFSEQAARFYASEVLLALEYLHMMGVVYRDLKPENVLVREDGHIMLSDFDLSLRCCVNPTLVKSSAFRTEPFGKISSSSSCIEPACRLPLVCVEPSCLQPSCFTPRLFSRKARAMRRECFSPTQTHSFPELLAEPTTARSMSFVGTHEYLAPEIIKGDGHGSAVDWWTYGVFLYELLYGKTPFKGNGNRATLFNVVGQPLKFPELPPVSPAAKDLIRGLLVKDPRQRLAYKRGATEIKQHPFFENISWALVRSTSPPEIPKPVSLNFVNQKFEAPVDVDDKDASDSDNSTSSYLDFEFF